MVKAEDRMFFYFDKDSVYRSITVDEYYRRKYKNEYEFFKKLPAKSIEEYFELVKLHFGFDGCKIIQITGKREVDYYYEEVHKNNRFAPTYIIREYTGEEYTHESVRKVFERLKPGDTVSVLERYLKEFGEVKTCCEDEFLHKFITKIDSPKFYRFPENKNTKTFDYIQMRVCVVQNWPCDKMKFVKANYKSILEEVLKKVEENARFKSFGIPVNFLKVTEFVLRKNSSIEVILEIKS